MTAKELADQATELDSRLKPGTWEAVQALALASIAQSLASVAACPREKQPGKGRSNRMLEQHCAVPFPFDGKITLRHGRPLCSIGLYRCLAGRTVHSLVDNLDTTVIDAVTGEVPRQLTLDTARQPLGFLAREPHCRRRRSEAMLREPKFPRVNFPSSDWR